MIVRNIERRPIRSAFAALGVAFSVALLVTSMFFYDAVDYMIDMQFTRVQREDLVVQFSREQGRSVLGDLSRLEGVTRVEAFRAVPVWLSSGHRRRSVAIMALESDVEMRRAIDRKRGPMHIPADGIMLGEKLAEVLHVSPGDTVTLRALEGRRAEAQVPVTALVDEMFGITAYMDYEVLHGLLGDAPLVSGAHLGVDAAWQADLTRRLQRLPTVAGVYSPAAMRASFEQMMDENLFISVTFLITLAAILGVGVIYNGARIALAERGHELASLRVLGFTRREVTRLLLGEQGLITLLAIPLGWGLGFLIGIVVLAQFDQERHRIPLVVTGQTYLYSALIAVVSAVLAGLAVRHRIGSLDLIEVLKTRE
jgi:putative ABC transport system permease protein